MEKSKGCINDIVIIDIRVHPCCTAVVTDAILLVGNERIVKTCAVDNTFVEQTTKELHSHDAEQEPEDGTDKKNIANSWN